MLCEYFKKAVLNMVKKKTGKTKTNTQAQTSGHIWNIARHNSFYTHGI